MFQGQGIFEILQHGGLTVLILGALSLASWAMILDRALRLLKLNQRDELAWDQGRRLLQENKIKELGEFLSSFPEQALWSIFLKESPPRSSDRARRLRRVLEDILDKLERPMIYLATIGSTSVFIGLFGTVLGIIRAFGDIAQTGGGGFAVVAGGISEALVATAAGIFVAVPAVAGYNILSGLMERLRARGEALIQDLD